MIKDERKDFTKIAEKLQDAIEKFNSTTQDLAQDVDGEIMTSPKAKRVFVVEYSFITEVEAATPAEAEMKVLRSIRSRSRGASCL